MAFLLLAPFIIQAIVIGFDEYYFHVKRGLPLWERIGHPIDTLTLLLCILFILFVPYSPLAMKWYIGLAIFSCLMVTKDEWIHKHHCPAAEQWLHALLFINHPIILAVLGLIWWSLEATQLPVWMSSFIYSPYLYSMVVVQGAMVTLFLLYQIIYWNFLWKEKITSP